MKKANYTRNNIRSLNFIREFSWDKALAKIMKLVSSRYFLWFCFCWFIFQALYFAVSTKYGLPPDEHYHYKFIELFARNGLSPIIGNQEGYYILGEAMNTPFFLYHYLLSFPFRLFGDSNISILLLRTINITIAALSLHVIHLTSKVLRFSPFIRNLSIFMLVNTLMFVFLSASINYDNLVILLSLMAIYITILCVIKEITTKRLLYLSLIVVLGLLTKVTFIPIALVAFFVVIFHIYKQRTGFAWSNLRAHFSPNIIFILMLFMALSGLLLYKYGSNMLSYSTPFPACEQVHTHEKCMENPIYKRGQILGTGNFPTIATSTFEYVSRWISFMRERTFGILAHKSTDATKLISSWSQFILVAGFIAFVRRYKPKNNNFNIVLLFFLVYALALLNDNRSGYYARGLIDLAVQGRYLFPFIPFLYLVANKYILELVGKYWLQFMYILISLVVFSSASLPSYLIKTDREWYTQQTEEVNVRANNILNKLYTTLN